MTALSDRPRESGLFGLDRRSAVEEPLQSLHLFATHKSLEFWLTKIPNVAPSTGMAMYKRQASDDKKSILHLMSCSSQLPVGSFLSKRVIVDEAGG